MQAILFPHTYVSETGCDAVRACFEQVRIYQPTRRLIPLPLQAMSQKGLIAISIPADRDDKKIERLVKDYRNWANLHPGGLRDYLKLYRGSIPFFDDTSVARIRTDIRHPGAEPEGVDPLLNARVFLQVAQEYDLESEEIFRRLAATDQAERNLYRRMAGEPDAPDPGDLQPAAGENIAAADYMVQPRVLAWSQLFLEDKTFDPREKAAVFVTMNREALEFLIEQAPAVEPIFQVQSIPIVKPASSAYDDFQNQFARILNFLPENAETAAAELIAGFSEIARFKRKAGLTLYRIPDQIPSLFFAHCVDRALPQETRTNFPGECNHTLLGLVEIG